MYMYIYIYVQVQTELKNGCEHEQFISIFTQNLKAFRSHHVTTSWAHGHHVLSWSSASHVMIYPLVN